MHQNDLHISIFFFVNCPRVESATKPHRPITLRAAATAGSKWHTWPPNAVEAGAKAEAVAEVGIGVQSQNRGAHSNLYCCSIILASS